MVGCQHRGTGRQQQTAHSTARELQTSGPRHSDRHGNFACGNVLRTPLDQLIQTGMRATWVREYQRGIAECRISCPYFAFCGGGHPSNRYFEHGRMDGTKTDYCRNSKIALMEGVIRLAARHETARDRIRDYNTGFRELLKKGLLISTRMDNWDNRRR